MTPRDFFVGLDPLNKPPKFGESMSKGLRGLLRWNFLGGAIKPICHALKQMSHGYKDLISLDVCAKFGEFSCIPCAWKTAAYFTAKDAPPRPQRLTKIHKPAMQASWKSWLHHWAVSCKSGPPLERNSWKCENMSFWSPVGGAMTRVGYQYINLFISSILSSTWNVILIGQRSVKL